MKNIPTKNFLVFTLNGLIPYTIFVVVFGVLLVTILRDAVTMGQEIASDNALLNFYATVLSIGNVIMISVILAFGYTVWQYLLTVSWTYELSDNIFRSEFGVLNKKQVNIQFDRVQNVDITRSLVERMFNLATVRIQTSGSGFAEGVIPGLEREEAEKIRDFILERTS